MVRVALALVHAQPRDPAPAVLCDGQRPSLGNDRVRPCTVLVKVMIVVKVMITFKTPAQLRS